MTRAERIELDGRPRLDLVHDLFLPTLLFAALGGMSWAVRGCSGFGASPGCIFAGVLWGAAWWFIARDPVGDPTRRYSSAWIVLAVTIGLGFSGARGWMQWPSFFEGKLSTNYAAGESVPIARIYGFVWLFIAGVPWAGIGACLLAWCGSLPETRIWHWVVRIACGIGGGVLAWYLFRMFPQYFLPLYESMEARYQDWDHNPNLRRLINDSRLAILHLGIYLGFLAYEIGRRDWKNAVLISSVGVLNGVGWALCQNWKWAPGIWETGNFNWWRCWESSGGITIGIAYGVAYFLTNRRMSARERTEFNNRRAMSAGQWQWLAVYLGLCGLSSLLVLSSAAKWGIIYLAVVMGFGVVYHFLCRRLDADRPGDLLTTNRDANLERFGLYLGLLFGLGLSVRNGLKGWFNIYRGDEEYWSQALWYVLGPIYLILLVAICVWILTHLVPRDSRLNLFPHAAGLMWLVLIVQNVIAQLITGPLNEWNEAAFSIYYLLLFAITAVIVIHCDSLNSRRSGAPPEAPWAQ